MNLFNSYFFPLFLCAVVTLSCCVNEKTGDSSTTGSNIQATSSEPKVYSFEAPVVDQTFTPGEKIHVNLKKSVSTRTADSIKIYVDGILKAKLSGSDTEAYIETGNISPGKKRLRMTVGFSDGKSETTSIPLRFVSDISPKQYTCRVTGTFPHDINSYTQGFEYQDGYFFEGTGQYGESVLRKTLPGTGDIIKSRNISPDLFGEGITVLKGKIYQITYRSQVGFIYDAASFEQIQKFYYQNAEGWGLCNNGSEIILSDGTNIIYFIDPEYFTVNRKIEVYDRVSEVDSLNELEYINGVIYANRYMTNEIVMIDPLTGKVTGKVDMRGLLKPEDRHPKIDVLNGIAWDETEKRLFVTGKNWPKIFIIEMVEK